MNIFSSLDWISSWWSGSGSTANQNKPSESSNKNDVPVTKPSQTPVTPVQDENGCAQLPVNTHSGDFPVTKPSKTQVTPIQNESVPAQLPVNTHSERLHIQLKYNIDFDQTVKVDRINLIVKCAGKTTEVDMFPLERISVLLKEACDRTGKKPEKMRLVYKGECLDVNKTVSHYSLRGGATVNLIPY